MLVGKSEAGSPAPTSGAPGKNSDKKIVDSSEARSPTIASAPAPAPATVAEVDPSLVPLLRLVGPIMDFQLSLASSPSDDARTRMNVVIDMIAELVRKSRGGRGGGT
jgi:hypothetical protein